MTFLDKYKKKLKVLSLSNKNISYYNLKNDIFIGLTQEMEVVVAEEVMVPMEVNGHMVVEVVVVEWAELRKIPVLIYRLQIGIVSN